MAIEIVPPAPFWLETTVRVLQRRPNNAVEVYEGGRYKRLVQRDGQAVLITIWQEGSKDEPRLLLESAGGSLDDTVTLVRRTLGIDVDVAAFFAKAEADHRFADVARALRGLRPPRFPTLFETLVNAVLFQQISLAAGVAIANRLAQRFGASLEMEGRKFTCAAAPEAIAEATIPELRAVGLSERKAAVLRDLAGLIQRGALTAEQLEPLASEEAIAQLTKLSGVGRWTAQVVLLRGLGRLDVFPHGDSGVRRGLARLLGQDAPLSEAAERELLDYFGAQRGMLYLLSLAARHLREGLLHDLQ